MVIVTELTFFYNNYAPERYCLNIISFEIGICLTDEEF